MAAKDLIPFNKRPEAERKAIQAKAVEASKQARKQKKLMKECLSALLELPAIDSKAKQDMIRRGIDPKQVDNMAILVNALWRRAADGNIFALKEVRNIIGQDDSSAMVRIKRQELKLREQELELKKQMMLGDDDDELSPLKIEIVRATKRVGVE